MIRSLAWLLVVLLPLAAHAAEPEADSSADGSAETDSTTRAREEFVRGAAFVRNAQWSEALQAFERSAQLLPHHVTTFNVAVCERALGRYVKARRTLALAQRQSQYGASTDPAFLESIRLYTEEVERLVARVAVTIEPADAVIAVDGRPLQADEGDGPTTLMAGVAPPGKGQTPPDTSFELLVDPGVHVMTVARAGFGELVLSRSFGPGRNPALKLELSKLPAQLVIGANRSGAVVRVNGVDVGQAPIELSRRAGKYDISVQREGYLPYRSRVTLHAGEKVTLTARLQTEPPAVTSRWWFWTAVGGAIAATALTTYVVTKPEPERPPVDGGGLGWALEVP